MSSASQCEGGPGSWQHVHGCFVHLQVMIFDFDVHHGNGTHDIFYEDPDVLFISTHQHGSYPNTGSLPKP